MLRTPGWSQSASKSPLYSLVRLAHWPSSLDEELMRHVTSTLERDQLWSRWQEDVLPTYTKTDLGDMGIKTVYDVRSFWES